MDSPDFDDFDAISRGQSTPDFTEHAREADRAGPYGAEERWALDQYYFDASMPVVASTTVIARATEDVLQDLRKQLEKCPGVSAQHRATIDELERVRTVIDSLPVTLQAEVYGRSPGWVLQESAACTYVTGRMISIRRQFGAADPWIEELIEGIQTWNRMVVDTFGWINVPKESPAFRLPGTPKAVRLPEMSPSISSTHQSSDCMQPSKEPPYAFDFMARSIPTSGPPHVVVGTGGQAYYRLSGDQLDIAGVDTIMIRTPFQRGDLQAYTVPLLLALIRFLADRAAGCTYGWYGKNNDDAKVLTIIQLDTELRRRTGLQRDDVGPEHWLTMQEGIDDEPQQLSCLTPSTIGTRAGSPYRAGDGSRAGQASSQRKGPSPWVQRCWKRLPPCATIPPGSANASHSKDSMAETQHTGAQKAIPTISSPSSTGRASDHQSQEPASEMPKYSRPKLILGDEGKPAHYQTLRLSSGQVYEIRHPVHSDDLRKRIDTLSADDTLELVTSIERISETLSSDSRRDTGKIYRARTVKSLGSWLEARANSNQRGSTPQAARPTPYEVIEYMPSPDEPDYPRSYLAKKIRIGGGDFAEVVHLASGVECIVKHPLIKGELPRLIPGLCDDGVRELKTWLEATNELTFRDDLDLDKRPSALCRAQWRTIAVIHERLAAELQAQADDAELRTSKSEPGPDSGVESGSNGLADSDPTPQAARLSTKARGKQAASVHTDNDPSSLPSSLPGGSSRGGSHTPRAARPSNRMRGHARASLAPRGSSDYRSAFSNAGRVRTLETQQKAQVADRERTLATKIDAIMAEWSGGMSDAVYPGDHLGELRDLLVGSITGGEVDSDKAEKAEKAEERGGPMFGIVVTGNGGAESRNVNSESPTGDDFISEDFTIIEADDIDHDEKVTVKDQQRGAGQ
ncbi:hypothetical protein LTR53_001143 [Teratosphaeriaceae sp. CCFEE 6253]|nr:hypothetical protein LTR53_001143 [Teratosphaeriaceae sp. CCFEE 6253]